jgi:hypothetical protein
MESLTNLTTLDVVSPQIERGQMKLNFTRRRLVEISNQ